MFLWSNRENYSKIIPVTPSYLYHCTFTLHLMKLLSGLNSVLVPGEE